MSCPGRAWRPTLLAAVACLLLISLTYARNGFEPADEGYYLNWLAHPDLYGASVTEFGYVYRPLYTLVEGDIVTLRRLNLGLTFTLGVWCAWQTLGALNELRSWTVACCVGAVSLRVFDLWLLTPNYNTLTLQGALVVVTGLMLLWSGSPRLFDLLRVRSTSPLPGAVAIGVGLGLLALAKPTSALAVALVVGLVLTVARRLTLGAVMVGSGSLLLTTVTSALVIDGSVATFTGRLLEGLADARDLAAGHTLSDVVRADRLGASPRHLAMALAIFAAMASLVWLTVRQPPRRLPWMAVIAASLGLLAAATVLRPEVVLRTGGRTALFLLAVPAAIVTARSVTRWVCADTPPWWRDQVVLVAGLLAVPFACVVGSNVNYWAGACDYAFFWMLAGVVALAGLQPDRQRAALVSLACAAAIAAGMGVTGGMAHPYRQDGPVWRMTATAVLADTRVVVDEETGRLLRDIRTAVDDAGMPLGAPMIDLSGQSPGLIHAVEATPIGSPWVIGGHAGSEIVGVRGLAQVECSALARAWVLTQPGGTRALSEEVLHALGLSVSDFVSVAEIKYPEYPRGPEPPLLLWRPVTDATSETDCRRARAVS